MRRASWPRLCSTTSSAAFSRNLQPAGPCRKNLSRPRKTSERHPGAELNTPHVARCANLAEERRRAEIGARVHQVDHVQHVGRFHPQLHDHAVGGSDIAEHAEVDVTNAGTIDDAPWCAAISADRRERK